MEYHDMFSLEVSLDFILLLILPTVIHHLTLRQLVIKNIFCHGILNEEAYMEQLPGFIVHGAYNLQKSLYNLK